MQNGISIRTGLFWTLAWVGFLLLYTLLEIAVWRKLPTVPAGCLHIVSITLCTAVFLMLLSRRNHFKIHIFGNIAPQGLILAACCVLLFYLVLDKWLDPALAKAFPASEEAYQETLASLKAAPVAALLQIGILAPLSEEILTRGFLLGGLSARYGRPAGLLISSLVFALLHFNMVQTLSAFLCGLVLGLLYLHSDSLFCCIVAHAGYNLVSFLAAWMPHGKA